MFMPIQAFYIFHISSTAPLSFIHDDVIFEMELVKQVEVNIDYILMLIAKFHASNCKDKEIRGDIDRAINSSLELRSKKELINSFIDSINAETQVDKDWQRFVQQKKSEETQRILDTAFKSGSIKTTGTDIDKLMPPVLRFGGGNRTEKKQGIIEKLLAFFDKYFGL
ncbi:MAG: hypothetical protein IJP15_05655 [Oscillospiraceae bacterium]|nr:hypothetical protein [Oscillospiraceae bacterium]